MDPLSPEAKRPRLETVVLACMDVRYDALAALGYQPPDAHVLRNAGALVTDDVVRSLVISQRLLGTRKVDIVAHTDCGAASAAARKLDALMERDLLSFNGLEESVRTSMARLLDEPDLKLDEVRGFVYDVETGLLDPIEP